MCSLLYCEDDLYNLTRFYDHYLGDGYDHRYICVGHYGVAKPNDQLRLRINELNKQNIMIFTCSLNKSKKLKQFKDSWMFDKNVIGIIKEFLVYKV